MRPWLSVIIPVYNSEAYLAELLDSVVAGLVGGVEIIAVDDGSTDGSPQVLARYRARLPITVIGQPNSGQGIARNTGIQAARGVYVYFLDSDDRVEKRLFRAFYDRLVRDAWPDILLFSASVFRADDAQGIGFRVHYDRGFEASAEPRRAAISRLIEGGGFFVSPCTYVSKQSIWQRHGLAFARGVYEDELAFIELMLCVATVSVSQAQWFARRIRAHSTMTGGQTRAHQAARRRNLRRALDTLAPAAGQATRYGRAWQRYIGTTAIVYIQSSKAVGVSIDWRLLKRAFGCVRAPALRLRIAAHLLPGPIPAVFRALRARTR